MRRSLPAAAIAAVLTISTFAPCHGLAGQIAQPPDASINSGGAYTAKTYFEHARTLGFPAAGQAKPYLLRAEFTTRASSGTIATGTCTDSFVDDKHWRREAVLGESRFVRSRNGKKWYRQVDGPDATLLQFVLTALEPLPDGKRRSDWKIQPDLSNGAAVTRVWRGRLSVGEIPDPAHYEAYWFDASGQLIRSYLNGLEVKRENFEDFNGVRMARQLQVIVATRVGMKIKVTAVGPLGPVDPKMFALKGDEWLPDYSEEVR